VHVVHQQRDRLLDDRAPHQLDDRLEQPGPLQLGILQRRRRRGGQATEQPTEIGQSVTQSIRSYQRPQRLDHRRVGEVTLIDARRAAQRQKATLFGARQTFDGKPGLAHPGRTGQGHHLAASGRDLVEQLAESGQFPPAPDRSDHDPTPLATTTE
jgi:hypothetical protein